MRCLTIRNKGREQIEVLLKYVTLTEKLTYPDFEIIDDEALLKKLRNLFEKVTAVFKDEILRSGLHGIAIFQAENLHQIAFVKFLPDQHEPNGSNIQTSIILFSEKFLRDATDSCIVATLLHELTHVFFQKNVWIVHETGFSDHLTELIEQFNAITGENIPIPRETA